MRGATDTDVARACADDFINDTIRDQLESDHQEAFDGPPVIGISFCVLLVEVLVAASCWLIFF